MLESVYYFMSKLKQKGLTDLILLWVNTLPKAKKPNAITRYFDKLIVLMVW